MKIIRRLSHREFIYLNKDNPCTQDVVRYLRTIGENQINKFCKKVSFKKIINTFIYYKNSFKKKPFLPKKHSFVPQPKFSTYKELKNSTVNAGNISGYWGEHIITQELISQKFLINTSCKVENKYGDLDIIAYKKRKNGEISHIEFHEVKTLTKGCSKENINLSIESQMRHLLTPQQRKGGEIYVQEILQEQKKLGNKHAEKLLQDMKSAKVTYFLHKLVIDSQGKQITAKRQSVAWKQVYKKSIVWAYVRNFWNKTLFS